MSITYCCEGCGCRWKIVPSDDTRDENVRCPNCPPPGQLIAQTFSDCCPEPKDAA